jgi:hypothetical protein
VSFFYKMLENYKKNLAVILIRLLDEFVYTVVACEVCSGKIFVWNTLLAFTSHLIFLSDV